MVKIILPLIAALSACLHLYSGKLTNLSSGQCLPTLVLYRGSLVYLLCRPQWKCGKKVQRRFVVTEYYVGVDKSVRSTT